MQAKTAREMAIEEGKEHRLTVINLRKQGLSFAQIGERCGYTRARAFALWKQALERGEAAEGA